MSHLQFFCKSTVNLVNKSNFFDTFFENQPILTEK